MKDIVARQEFGEKRLIENLIEPPSVVTPYIEVLDMRLPSMEHRYPLNWYFYDGTEGYRPDVVEINLGMFQALQKLMTDPNVLAYYKTLEENNQ